MSEQHAHHRFRRLGSPANPGRPDTAFDVGMQQERTQMAWERTAFSLLVAGAAIGRSSVADGYLFPAIVGGLIVVLATFILLWAAGHYEELHGQLRAGLSPVHPTSARVVGIAAIIGSGVGLVLGLEKVILG